MSLDIIKEYLVGIGFQIDSNSLKTAEEGMNSAEKTINNFNDNNNKGFQESGEALGDFFTLLGKTSGSISKLFPNLQTPFKGLIKDILIVKDFYKDLTKENKQTPRPTPNNETPQPNNTPTPTNGGTSSSLLEPLADGTDSTLSVLNKLPTEGVVKLKAFATGAAAAIAVTVAAIAVAVLAIKGLSKFLNDLANKDIEYEKLSRQLWTTKENAKEVSMALETMGATMQDLWLSPTLMKQFTQLRKDSAALKLPKEYTDNLKVIQGIGLEFKRLKQLGTLAFQWIGNYIMKYAAEPLAEIKQALHGLNEWFIKNIPNIGKVIGSILGFLIKIIAIILKLGAVLFKLMSPIFNIIKLIRTIGDEFKKIPEPIKKELKEIGVILLALASPILAIIALLDDLMTYFKGGKSLTGTFIDKFSKELDNVGKKIKNVIDYFRNLKNEILNSNFIKGLEGIGQGIKKGVEVIKNGDFNDLLGDISIKVKDFSNPNINRVAANYTTANSNSITTANSNNQVANTNTFNIYGSSNPTSTANATAKSVTGITQRNLQGAY